MRQNHRGRGRAGVIPPFLWFRARPEPPRSGVLDQATLALVPLNLDGYARCVEGAPSIRDGSRPDISRADFTWCMIAIDWGWSIRDVAARLSLESPKARENGELYAIRTAKRA